MIERGLTAGALLGLAALKGPSAPAPVTTEWLAAETHIEVERAGTAQIDQAFLLTIGKGGALHTLDVARAPGDDQVLAGAVLAFAVPRAENAPSGQLFETGTATWPPPGGVPLGVSAGPGGMLRLNVDATPGLSKGTFLFRVRYRKDLVGTGQLRREGGMVSLAWASPELDQGLDNVRCTFVLPTAPTAPRVGDASEATLEGGTMAFRLSRGTEHDQVELVRPHVARGESVTWKLRVDPRAFAGFGPAEPVTARAAPARPAWRAREIGLCCAIMVAFSALVIAKARRVQSQANDVAVPRPLVPWPLPARIALAGPSLALGALLQVSLDNPWWGTCLVLSAMALASYRRPRWLAVPRNPGRWLALTDEDAFCEIRPGSWLDASTTAGRIALVGSLAAVWLAAYAVSHVSTYAAHIIVFDSAVLVPIFGTGLRRDLPPDPLRDLGGVLGGMAHELRRRGIRVAAWARVAHGADRVDELRLLCRPRAAIDGFIGVEVGVVPTQGAGGRLDCPEILVRAVDASACHGAWKGLLPGWRWTAGRKARERVARIAPRLPTRAMTVALVERLVSQAAANVEQSLAADAPDQVASLSSQRRTSRSETSAPAPGSDSARSRAS
jgi:hypothetical protein